MPLSRLFPFLVIGGAAFLFTVAAYRAFTFVGLSPFAAQPLALWLSMTATWAANRRLTFTVAARPTWPEYARYLLASSLGAGVNYCVFALTLVAGANDIIALAVATLVATAFNFLAYARFVFSSTAQPDRCEPRSRLHRH